MMPGAAAARSSRIGHMQALTACPAALAATSGTCYKQQPG